MKVRKTLLVSMVCFGLIASSVPGLAQRGDDTDRASKNGKAEGSIQGISVTLEYGRPNVKGRQIWGGLVPYDKVWRTGANEATTITFSGAVAVEGEPLPAGTYALFTIPGESEWTIIFNKVAKQWGAMKYDAAEDALRVTVKPEPAAYEETMDFRIQDSRVILRWEKLAIPFSVTAVE